MSGRMWAGGAAAAVSVTLAVAGLLSWSGAAAAPSAPPAMTRDAQLGRDIYVTHCAACHGAEGRGDGPSAAAFATKPSDLTDGRLMNPLPDEFLSNVIRHGGPAEGLAPTMPPFDRTLSSDQISQVVRYLRSVAQPAYRPEESRSLVHVPGAPAQPILFSHVVHAGSFQIACQHCHTEARRSAYAGLPSVERCMGCHRIIGAQDNPEIQKIHGYAERGEPVPWVRVFKMPEFTYFPHKPHVRAGVECQSCHGPVERMRVVGATTGPRLLNDLKHLVGLRPPSPPLTMGWCLDCHREQNATRGMRAPLDCVACHH
ncbi:MAG TPA: c-type cytochrome [Candidatus Limnocylindria bacterium]|nr:c-type cytochrome [Candidatus Limnocylindria bacterium]